MTSNNDMKRLEIEFHKDVIEAYKCAKSECGYNATKFIQMVSAKGALNTARDFIKRNDVTTGFETLWEKKRLDLTIEYHVTLPKYKLLFSLEERQTARQRLREYDFIAPEEELETEDKENEKVFSWEVITGTVILKHTDKSTFLHHGTGIPREVRPFFEIETMTKGEERDIVLLYGGNEHTAKIEIDNQNNPRSRLFWKADFDKVIRSLYPNIFEQYQSGEKYDGQTPILRFKKVTYNRYGVVFIDSKMMNTVLQDIESEVTEEDTSRKEGAIKEYYGKRFERDATNRARAIEIHGLNCIVCGFNFEKVYGERGKNFIEIHHIKPLSTHGGESVTIIPECDLVPLCSNCHRMVHRRQDDILSIEQLKNILMVE